MNNTQSVESSSNELHRDLVQMCTPSLDQGDILQTQAEVGITQCQIEASTKQTVCEISTETFSGGILMAFPYATIKLV